jgi:hypothetical protein
MQEKTRLVLELRESTDQLVRNANAKVPTGRKWNAQTEVDQAVSRLQHREIVGRVQAGRAGPGWGEAPRFWSKANRKEGKEMVVAGVTRMEEDRNKIKAVSQGRQGSWTTWEGVVNRNISWSDMWKIPQARLSFLIPSTYNTLPCPWNLQQWFGNEECCSLCNAHNASLLHILSGCKIAFTGALQMAPRPGPEKASQSAGGVSTGYQRTTISRGPHQLCLRRRGKEKYQANRNIKALLPRPGVEHEG